MGNFSFRAARVYSCVFSVRIISMRQILFSIFSSVIILFRLIFRICLNLLAVEVNLLENFDGRARDVDVIR